MAETDVFYCEVREKSGTGAARAARRDGWVPGVLYGGGESPVAIRLRYNEVNKAFGAGRMKAHMAKIDVPGQKILQPVIAREVQTDPVMGFPMHVDLLRVSETTRIDVEVPVRFLNEEESPGLKRGGVLNIVRHTVELNAPAGGIPEFLEADITGLDIGDVFHISSVKLPEGVVPGITDRDFTIATIAAPSAVRSADSGASDGGEETTEEAPTEANDD